MPIPDSPPEQLAHSTVRIKSHYSDGTTGMGTGFFFNFDAKEGNKRVPVLVTNKHVVNGSERGTFVLTSKAVDGGPNRGQLVTIDVTDFAKKWIDHPDSSVDLCIMPVGPLIHQARKEGHNFFFTSIGEDLLPTEAEIKDFVGLEDVIMVGYPQGLWDSTNNQPIFRRGILASDYRNDWNGKKVCLIDAACFPGSSGSPVFLYNPTGYLTQKGVTLDGRMKLLGILFAGPLATVEGEIKIVTVPTQQKPISLSTIPMNLGIIIKSERLRDFQNNLPGMLAKLLAKQ